MSMTADERGAVQEAAEFIEELLDLDSGGAVDLLSAAGEHIEARLLALLEVS